MATKVIKTVIQVRRDTTENWLKNQDVIPAAGEPCFNTDTGEIRWGDGKTSYGKLPSSDQKIKVLADVINEHETQIESRIIRLQELVGDTPVSEQITTIVNQTVETVVEKAIENSGMNLIEEVRLAGTKLPIEDKILDIPIGSETTLGVVKSSVGENRVQINADGTMEVKQISFDKITQAEEDTVVITGGSANG